MIKILFIAAGGSIGALLRYGVSIFSNSHLSGNFPWATLIVNLTGSFIIGTLLGLLEFIDIPENIRIFLFIGILGSFTTFSTFSLENLNLLKNGEHLFLFWNVFLNVAVGLGLAFLGYFAGRSFMIFVK